MSKSFKYVKEFEFPSDRGYTGSAGRQPVKGYMRGGQACAGYAEGGKARVKDVVRNERRELNRVEAKRRDAGQEIARVRSEMRYDKNEMKSPGAGLGMLADRSSLGIRGNKDIGETPMRTAPNLPGSTMLKKGGAVSKKGAYKVAKVMGEFQKGKLHSGSKSGPKVSTKKQAVAIALSEARRAGKK
jgi:hypothetical protein